MGTRSVYVEGIRPGSAMAPDGVGPGTEICRWLNPTSLRGRAVAPAVACDKCATACSPPANLTGE